MLRQEFSVGKRLGEPVAHRIRGCPAEPRHDELEFPVARDEPSSCSGAALGFPARRPLVALDPDELGCLLVEQRVEEASSTDAMFADAARVPFVDDLLFSRLKSYDDAWTVFLYVSVNLCKKLCVISLCATTKPYGLI